MMAGALTLPRSQYCAQCTTLILNALLTYDVDSQGKGSRESACEAEESCSAKACSQEICYDKDCCSAQAKGSA